MSNTFKTYTPIDGSVYLEEPYTNRHQQAEIIQNAKLAQHEWRTTTVAQRKVICEKFIEYFQQHKDECAKEITYQMGRPISQSGGEINGLIERTQYMIDIAETNLCDIQIDYKENFTRFIRRNPLGVVLVIAPWNYPYLTAVNSIIPAIMSGNCVILKHSSQTPLCAKRFAEAFSFAGLPEGVFQYAFMTHEHCAVMMRHPYIDYVAFTGSVDGGKQIQNTLKNRFIHVGLELGGKDPAYVCADCNLDATVANLVDGAFFNSGQSCCGIERIYVDHTIFKDFVEKFCELTRLYHLGNPLDPDTNLGPVVRTQAAQTIQQQIIDAIDAGAKALIDPDLFQHRKLGANYLAPQVMIDVTHQMHIMTEETFGPVVGIMPVKNAEQAIHHMNDSYYGLSASIWTNDLERALDIGKKVNTGTWFMNRCDYLDPALVWTGVKNTGKGYTLSQLGYQQLTQAKSFHLRHTI